jgi:hypothetical protein
MRTLARVESGQHASPDMMSRIRLSLEERGGVKFVDRGVRL